MTQTSMKPENTEYAFIRELRLEDERLYVIKIYRDYLWHADIYTEEKRYSYNYILVDTVGNLFTKFGALKVAIRRAEEIAVAQRISDEEVAENEEA